MRISTNQMLRSGLDVMLRQQAEVSRTQQQLGSGVKLLSSSDDPVGASRILGLEQAMKINDQYQSSIDSARARLNLEESHLGTIYNVYNRVRELAIQGNNATISNENRDAISKEMQERLNELHGLSNARDANGEYIFAGFRSKIQPFVVDANGQYQYNGDNGQRFVQIGASNQVAIGDAGSDVFLNIANGNGRFSVADDSANSGTGVIAPGNVVNASQYVRGAYDITFPITTAATNTLSFTDAGVNDNLAYTLSINGNVVYTVDEAGTSVNTLSGLAAQINDDSQTTGVRAIVLNNTLHLANVGTSTAPIVVEEALSGNTPADGDGDGLTGYFGSNLTGLTTPSVTTTFTAGVANTYMVEDGAGNLVTSGQYTAGETIAFNGLQTSIKGEPQQGDRFLIRPSQYKNVFSSIQDISTVFEQGATGPAATGPAATAQLNNAVSRFLTDIDQAMSTTNEMRALVGSRQNGLDSQEGLNEDNNFQLSTTLSSIRDLDYAEAISLLQQQMIGLEASQKAFVRVQELSLFNFI